MRITILAVGTRGDVQPYVALGRGLQAAGYEVRLATHFVFEDFVRGQGLDFFPIAGDIPAMMTTAAAQKGIQSGRSAVNFIEMFLRLGLPIFRKMSGDMWQAAQGSEAILYSTLAFGGYYIAQKLDIPSYGVLVQPITRTRAFPSLFVPGWLRLGGRFNYLTHILGEQFIWQAFRPIMNRWLRRDMDMRGESFFGSYGQLYREGRTFFYGISPHVLPKPDDWPESHHLCGYWTLEDESGWQPSEELLAFLDDGPPPVYVGFGSMASQRADEAAEIVLKALAQTGQRGLLLRGWGGLSPGDLPKNVFLVDSAPHAWLFPRMAAVVHHGGAGTTAAGLRAGVPSILVPHFSDQPFWADRVRALGVGPKGIARSKLTADKLADAINQAMGDKQMQRRAAELGAKLRAEDGVANAVNLIQQELA